MAVIKPTRSGKAVLFICDDGVSYMTSVSYLKAMLNNPKPTKFLQPVRFPLKVSEDRFKKSDIWDPNTRTVIPREDWDENMYIEDNDGISQVNDAISTKATKVAKETDNYIDKIIEW